MTSQAQELASLDGPADSDRQAVEEAWAREIERRARRVLTGHPAAKCGVTSVLASR